MRYCLFNLVYQKIGQRKLERMNLFENRMKLLKDTKILAQHAKVV